MGLSCMSKHYTYQEFLLHCPYHQIVTEDYYCSSEYDLLNYHDKSYSIYDYLFLLVRRYILLTDLDKIVDTAKNFDDFIEEIKWIDELIIVNDRPSFHNPILKTYSQNTIKAYLYRINRAGIKCRITANHENDRMKKTAGRYQHPTAVFKGYGYPPNSSNRYTLCTETMLFVPIYRNRL